MVGSTRLAPRRHCVWGEDRTVSFPDGTFARAVEHIDVKLAPRRYCTHCMRTLAAAEESCPTGSPSCEVVEAERRVHGWIGLQRYLHNTEFGLDFIRNGRKIEIANKDLFEWSDGDVAEVEYPTDDQRGRGRFVGEIHIDHCRVSYTKDRFERDDPAWSEMVRVVRGEGPLRPIVAKQRGYAGNDSPLYQLYQTFRRSSPQGKNGLWSRVLVVKDNDRAQQMANLFEEDDPDYLTDDRWWQLVLEQDKEVLGEKPAEGGDAPLPPGFVDEPPAGDPGDQTTTTPPPQPQPEPPPARRQIHELSRKYVHPTFRVEYEIQAYGVARNDPDLPSGLPWVLKLNDVATRTYGFLVDVSLLADEEARRRQDVAAAALERDATLRALEDERDQIVSALSGTPGGLATVSGDRATLRARLDELNKEIQSISEDAGRGKIATDTAPDDAKG